MRGTVRGLKDEPHPIFGRGEAAHRPGDAGGNAPGGSRGPTSPSNSVACTASDSSIDDI